MYNQWKPDKSFGNTLYLHTSTIRQYICVRVGQENSSILRLVKKYQN